MTSKRRLAATLSLLLMAAVAFGAKELILVNTDSNGVVLQGYDPVAYFTQKAAVQGDPKFNATYKGATYYFTSEANQKLFKENPAKYAPQYGGYCAMAVAMGKLEDADPKMFTIHNNKLLVQHNEKAHQMFMSNPDGFHQKADQQWPGLVEKNGKPERL
jgi:YHS domain-containing protein